MNSRISFRNGFTIIELLLVITILAILVTISIVAYNGIQKRASINAMTSDLNGVASVMERAAIGNQGIFPNNIPTDVQTSPDVSLSLVAVGGIYYWGLSPSQNGKLFHNHCLDLVAEGYGRGPNDANAGEVDYISGCEVKAKDFLQLTGWNGGFKVSNPDVSKVNLLAFIDSAGDSDKNHPSYKITLDRFIKELIKRSTTEGVTFPITSFWDPWANKVNGVKEPTLPNPEPSLQTGRNYCIEAIHATYDDLHWKITSEELYPHVGTCS